MDGLELEREVQRLRLELEEARDQLMRLQEELGRRRGQESTRVSDVVDSLQQELMQQMASPMAQLLTQIHLVEVEKREVAGRDMVSVAKRIFRALEDVGLAAEGKVGEMVPFDPCLHEPLGDFHPGPGEPVTVRMVGMSHQGRRLRRAGVVALGR